MAIRIKVRDAALIFSDLSSFATIIRATPGSTSLGPGRTALHSINRSPAIPTNDSSNTACASGRQKIPRMPSVLGPVAYGRITVRRKVDRMMSFNPGD